MEGRHPSPCVTRVGSAQAREASLPEGIVQEDDAAPGRRPPGKIPELLDDIPGFYAFLEIPLHHPVVPVSGDTGEVEERRRGR